MKRDFHIMMDIVFLTISVSLFFIGLNLISNGYPQGSVNVLNWYVIAGVILVNIMNIISNKRNKRKYAIIASITSLIFCIIFLLIPQIILYSIGN